MTHQQQQLVNKTAEFIEKKFKNDPSGHDWWHMCRVWRMAKYIASKEENVDMLVVELAALLHDIADHKFHSGDMEIGATAAGKWLKSIKVDNKTIAQVQDIINNISNKKFRDKLKNDLKTIEGQIVHDADKLDALGAIGIARLFRTGGHLSQPIYDPSVALDAKYGKSAHPWGYSDIHHFYEKLLMLKDRMFTKTGRQMAEHRHKYMEDYLKEFYAEWDGKL